MAEEKKKLPCIHVCEGDIPPRVLVCGDPARAERIGMALDGGHCLKKNREYWTFVGEHKGVPVAVTSHGVGAGGACIGFESLWRAGAKVIIRVGTCGGMQPDVKAGDAVIVTGACREEGVTEKMLPLSYPAIADDEVVGALSAAARENGVTAHKGIVLTSALFYASFLPSHTKLFSEAGVLALENEVAGLLVVASSHGTKAGAILTVDAPAFEVAGVEGYQPDMDEINRSVDRQIQTALDAIVSMEV